MKNAFVAFFDVLGFKNLVQKNNHEDLLEIYHESIYESLDMDDRISKPIISLITPIKEKASLDIKTFVVSDSIILIQEDLTFRGLCNLIAMAQRIVSMSFVNGIPLRGAISFGPITILQNSRGTNIVGLGLVNAYQLEQTQAWAGGIVDKKCFEQFPFKRSEHLIKDLLKDKQNPLIIKYNIPLKDKKKRVGYGLTWPKNPLLRNQDDIINAFTMHSKDLPEDQKMTLIDNSVAYFLHVKKLLNF